VSVALASGCIGDIGGGVPGPSAQALNEIAASGARRLTATEYNATIRDLLGIEDIDSSTAFEDGRTPFDNDYTQQIASEALITAADSLAGELAARVVADPALRARVVPCEPAAPADAECYRSFVTSFGRRACRRPLADSEVERFMAFLPHATEANDFWVAVDSALRAFLQHPAFLYRIEIGEPVAEAPGVQRLSDSELATRMSYLFWGSTPPDWLLDDVAAGTLVTTDGVRAVADKLMADRRARERVARFHAMWLSYEALPLAPELAAAMQLETQSLLDRVIFDQRRPWQDVLRATRRTTASRRRRAESRGG
jgi:hypothetical protein